MSDRMHGTCDATLCTAAKLQPTPNSPPCLAMHLPANHWETVALGLDGLERRLKPQEMEIQSIGANGTCLTGRRRWQGPPSRSPRLHCCQAAPQRQKVVVVRCEALNISGEFFRSKRTLYHTTPASASRCNIALNRIGRPSTVNRTNTDLLQSSTTPTSAR